VYIIFFIKDKASIELSTAKAYLIFFITLERSKTRQDKFESILEIIESIVSSPFVKAEADSVEYFVLCLKRYVRLH
jgi:hypothetical protein